MSVVSLRFVAQQVQVSDNPVLPVRHDVEEAWLVCKSSGHDVQPSLHELKALPCDDDMSDETEAFCCQLQVSLVSGNFFGDPVLCRSFCFYL
jgi:hypothetical protein